MPRIVFYILLFLLSNAASASTISTTRVFDLFSVYTLALDNAPELQVARKTLQAEKQVLAKSRAGLLPSLAISGEYSRVEQRAAAIEGLVPASDNHYPREIYQATLTQPLFNLQTWFGFQAGKAMEKEARARYRESLQDFRMRVVKAYFEALRAQSQLMTREAEFDAVKRQRRQVDKQFDAGIVSVLELQEIRAEAKRVKVSVIRAEGRVDQTFRSLQSDVPENLPSLSVLLLTAKTTNPISQELADLVECTLPALTSLLQKYVWPAGRDLQNQTTSGLTPKENHVVELLTSGASTSDMSNSLGVARRTIQFHLQNIYRKLGASNRQEAIVFAQQSGSRTRVHR
jgi:outer membrane protein TolC/DNA-binding CsgD family transcriptional regulator